MLKYVVDFDVETLGVERGEREGGGGVQFVFLEIISESDYFLCFSLRAFFLYSLSIQTNMHM